MKKKWEELIVLPIIINLCLLLLFILFVLFDYLSLFIKDEHIYPVLCGIAFIPILLFVFILPFKYLPHPTSKVSVIIMAVISYLLFCVIYDILFFVIIKLTPTIAILTGILFTPITLFVLLSYLLSTIYNLLRPNKMKSVS
jgi:hypothetical protein